MGKASSNKKIQRVQRAGTTKVAGQRRPLGFPLLLLAIFVVGGVLIYFAREARVEASAIKPEVNRDHWHVAFGVYKCDEYPGDAQALNDVKPDVLGIHSHGDGLIHIHPFSSGVSGKRATFGAFADQVGIELADGKVTVPTVGGDDLVLKDGDTCEITGDDGKKTKEPAELKMFLWPPQANEKIEPKVVSADFGNIRFVEDQAIMALALVPKGTTKIPLPPSVSQLASPSDLNEPPAPAATLPGGLPAPTETAPTVPPTDTPPAGASEGDAPAEAPATTAGP